MRDPGEGGLDRAMALSLSAVVSAGLRESWIRGCPDGRTMTFGRTPGL